MFEFLVVVGVLYGLWFSLGQPAVFHRAGSF